MGIQATLNARTSILAAANPLYGRYDRTKTLRANVNISPPIMSRFDLFFVVLDECNEDSDRNIANHIVANHCGGESVQEISPPYTVKELTLYIRYIKFINPVIPEATRQVMVDSYRNLRQNDCIGRNRTSYKITVRQLESLVRLSEALARLHLDQEVKPAYVLEAFRLIRKSIIHVDTEDIGLEDGDVEEEEDIDISGENNNRRRKDGRNDDNDEVFDDDDIMEALA